MGKGHPLAQGVPVRVATLASTWPKRFETMDVLMDLPIFSSPEDGPHLLGESGELSPAQVKPQGTGRPIGRSEPAAWTKAR